MVDGTSVEWLERNATVAVLAGFALVSAVFGYLVFQQDKELRENAAVEEATAMANVLLRFREVYTRDVVRPAMASGLQVRHDYHTVSGAIPLPATLTHELGADLGTQGGATAKLYSPYPFPWRKHAPDEFRRAAWDALSADPQQRFYRFGEGPDGRILRVAIADVLRPECVGCHNAHASSPKTDWSSGDVRGVLEVAIPMQKADADTQAVFRRNFPVFAAFAALVLFLALVLLRLLDRRRQDLELLVNKRTEELMVARDAAESANRAKSAFLATMSHELRTPLNAVIGFSGVLMRNKDGKLDERQLDKLGRIRRSGEHLLGLINEILDLARIESGELDISTTQCSVSSVIAEVIELSEVHAEERGLELSWSVPDGARPILADVQRLRQVLLNLVSNALKFTEEGGVQVMVTVRDEDSSVQSIEVRDTGIGIAADQLDQMFLPFRQAESTYDRRHAGTGLGLTISRALCREMGFTLQAQSEFGVGTTFRLLIPRESTSPEVDEA